MCYDSTSILNSPKPVKIIFWIITILSILIHIFGAFCILRKTPKSVKSVRYWLFNFHLWSLFLDVTLGFVITPFLFLPTLTFRAYGFLEGYEQFVPYFAVLTFAGTGFSLVLLLENRHHSLTMWEVTTTRKICRAIFYTFNIVFLFLFPLITTLYVPNQKIGREEAIKVLPCLSEVPDIFIIVTDLNAIFIILTVLMIGLFLVIFQCIFFAWSIFKASDFSENISKLTIALQRKFLISILIQKSIPSSSLVPPVFYAVFCVYNNIHWQKLTNILIFVVTSHGIIGSVAMLCIHKSYTNTVIDLILCRRIKQTLLESEQSKITRVLNNNNNNIIARRTHSNPTHSSTMAQSVPPGDIQTQPNAKIVFNAPYDDKHTYHIKVINSSARRIGYGIKTTNMKRLGVDPPCGVLDPKEAVLLAVSCDAFAYGQEDTNNDRITVEWTNTPDGAAKQFRREWFQGDGMVRRKNLPIEYNP
ncbi:unnamed protein product [Caenorhabditis angaria]|uniref:Major sperm protein n=1 Tax=Caenorhabditis angaria TaxID=860376 RepID=A0A9P1N2Y1_9PELO|nr:unnamed protein product [Caenorhabditis angaria]